jgi:hypothetical protein
MSFLRLGREDRRGLYKWLQKYCLVLDFEMYKDPKQYHLQIMPSYQMKEH